MPIPHPMPPFSAASRPGVVGGSPPEAILVCSDEEAMRACFDEMLLRCLSTYDCDRKL
ncbi:hypothetical protein LY76DRAFT_586638 [Colletotrichum caudatum]|nr:hypothetical protein LY76DRAFT_586638 [Colletotrichum caudatum]